MNKGRLFFQQPPFVYYNSRDSINFGRECGIGKLSFIIKY